MMITSKVGTTGRTTIPKLVRSALNLNSGDKLAYGVGAGFVTITKLVEPPPADPFVIFSEWNSEADCRAYANF